MAGELLIVTGPPGAGKSTVAAALSELRAPSALVEGDGFFAFLRAGRIDPWLVASRHQNDVITNAAGAATGRFVGGGYWTVYEGVIGAWSLPGFLQESGLRRVHYVVLLPPVETCVERVVSRVGHGFTDEAATRHMHAEFARAEIPPRHVVRDIAAPDEVVGMIVDRLVAGELAHPD